MHNISGLVLWLELAGRTCRHNTYLPSVSQLPTTCQSAQMSTSVQSPFVPS